jgi:hypothetical protein
MTGVASAIARDDRRFGIQPRERRTPARRSGRGR